MDMIEDIAVIYGKHAVREALTYRADTVRGVFLMDGFSDSEFLEILKKSKVPYRGIMKLPKGIQADAVHQGVVAEIIPAKLVMEYDDFISDLTVTPATALVVLGEVQDPHNVGALIRSAVAFGVSGILIPEHRQVQINGTIIKVSAGMAFRIPLIKIGNVNNTISDLKERGFWVYGLDGEATQVVTDEKFEKPSVFILGNEATGIRQKTLEHCDIPLRIPMSEKAESLNASVAGAIVLYAWSTFHRDTLR